MEEYVQGVLTAMEFYAVSGKLANLTRHSLCSGFDNRRDLIGTQRTVQESNGPAATDCVRSDWSIVECAADPASGRRGL